MLTLIVPSRVLAITVLLRPSLARPVIHRSFRFVLEPTMALSGIGPTSNVLRFVPDCILNMLMTPVEDDAIPKLPQAEMQVAYAREVSVG